MYFYGWYNGQKCSKSFYIHIWNNHGFFNFIIFERGRTFINYFLDQLITNLGIKTILSTAYYPETDKQTEILNSIFEQYFRVYVNFSQNDWAFWLFSTEFVINNHVSEITPCTLFLFNSNQHFNIGLEPDFFISKFIHFKKKKKKKKSSLTSSWKKCPRSMKFSENKWFSFRFHLKNFANKHKITPQITL